jgi:hypothetical protein
LTDTVALTLGFDRAHELRGCVEESQLDQKMTLGILLERYAFVCRKRPAAPETLDRFGDPPTRSTEQADVVNLSRRGVEAFADPNPRPSRALLQLPLLLKFDSVRDVTRVSRRRGAGVTCDV